MLALAFAALASSPKLSLSGPALKRDDAARRTLALRGGAKVSDIARYAGTGLMLADGIGRYAYPHKVVAKSLGADTSDVPAVIAARSEGQWRIGLAIMLLADASDARALIALSHYICVVNLLGDIPGNDALDAPQAPIIVLVAVFGALGFGTARGVVPNWLSPFSGLLNGLQFYLTPKRAWAAYGADGKGVSDLALAKTRRIGWDLLLRGIYLGSIIAGVARKDAFGYVFAATAVNGILNILSGETKHNFERTPRSQVSLLVLIAALIAALSLWC